MNDIYISKVWAMPNGNTFTIKPIKEFVEIEVNKGGLGRNNIESCSCK